MGIRVSVIIPVYNNAKGVEATIDALLGQSFPQEDLEIIIADNGSDDETPQAIEKQPVRIVRQSNPGSPYTARNRALEIAGGDVIVFTDSDCVPDSDWIQNGITLMAREKADLVGGYVAFRYSERPSAAEIYDSLVNLEVEQNVKLRGVAKTGNLFVKKSLFDEIGLFHEEVRSGGDVTWTGKATGAGYRMVFGKNVVVRKEARTLRALLKKMYRVGRGQPAIWLAQGRSAGSVWKTILYDFRPATPRFIHSLIDTRGEEWQREKVVSLMWIAWLTRIWTAAGRVAALMEARPDTKKVDALTTGESSVRPGHHHSSAEDGQSNSMNSGRANVHTGQSDLDPGQTKPGDAS